MSVLDKQCHGAEQQSEQAARDAGILLYCEGGKQQPVADG